MNRNSFNVAYCGVTCALSLIVMFAAIIPSMTYVMPAVSGVVIWTVCGQVNRKWAFMTYAAAAVMSLFFVPEKESMIYFVMIFGYYPLIRDLIHRFSFAPIRFLIKLVFFNATAILAFTIVVKLFVDIGQVLEGMEIFGDYAVFLLLLLGNGVFFFYDLSLRYVYYAFSNWITPAIKRKIK